MQFEQDSDISNDTSFIDIKSTVHCNGLDEIDPDIFLNKELPDCILDTPIFSTPYAQMSEFCKFKQPLSILSFNIRSLLKNIDEFRIFLNQLPIQFSIICLQETWAKDEVEENFDSRFEINGYNCYHVPRGDKKIGGGLCVYVKHGLNIKERPDLKLTESDIEAQFIEVVMKKSKNIMIGNLYRPPRGKMGVFNKKIIKFMKTDAKSKNLYLCGDMNLNMFNCETDPKVRKYINNIKQHFFMPAITKATRVTMRKATCIDNILFNVNFNKNINSGIFEVKISDHFPIFLLIEGALEDDTIHNNDLIKIVKPVINDQNISMFEQKIKDFNWDSATKSQDANESYDNFISDITKIYDECFPVQTQYLKQKSIVNKWMTKGLLKASKRKQKLYKKFLKCKSRSNEKAYKNYAKIFDKLLQRAKKLHYTGLIKKHEGNIKKLWSTMKEIISKNKENIKNPNFLQVNGRDLWEKRKIAEEFNKFFVNVGPDLASKVKPAKSHFNSFLCKISSKFKMEVILESELEDAFKNLKINKSPGYDKISAKIIKNCFASLKAPLLYLYNLSIKTGTFPDKMKLAQILPLFKSGARSIVSNYRPISLLPIFSKIFEKIIHKKLHTYLQEHNVLYNKQFGFRKNHSVDHGLIEVVNNISEGMAKKWLTIGVFIDLSKAFDTVDHDILLQKLKNYGIEQNEHNFFRSYLSNRSQYVKIDGVLSNTLDVKCGVPQGSVLGPLLFLIYVNDMHRSVPLLNVIMFADDTNLFISGNDYKDMFSKLNSQLKLIDDWFAANKLSLNTKKTKYTVFCSKSVEENLPLKLPDLEIGGKTICRSRYAKFLGVLIDENLTWNKQIQTIESKVSSQIGIISRARKFLSNDAMNLLYNSFVNPYLNYGNVVWGSVPKSKLQKLHTLQKRAIRIVTYSPRYTHSRPLMLSRKILNIYELNLYKTLLFMHSVFNLQAPPCLQTQFQKLDHKYPTRSSFSDFHFKQYDICKHNKYNLLKRGPKIWNIFTKCIKNLPFSTCPKHLIKTFLLSDLQTEIW